MVMTLHYNKSPFTHPPSLPKLAVYPPTSIVDVKTHQSSITHVTSYAGSPCLPTIISFLREYPPSPEYPRSPDYKPAHITWSGQLPTNVCILHSSLKYYGIIVGGRKDYVHDVTGDSMFLAKCIFVDLNTEFIEYDFDELDLDPTSPHKLDQARIVNLEEAIWASDQSGWLHHTVSKPSPAAHEWCEYRTVPQGHDKVTGYEVGYHGPKPYTSSPDMSTKKKKAVTFVPDLPTPKKKTKKASAKGSKRKDNGSKLSSRNNKKPKKRK